MSDGRNEIAPLDESAVFVTYSRIEPDKESDRQDGPILTGVRIESGTAPDEGTPDVRAEERIVPVRKRGRGAFLAFAIVALVAFAGGVGVLAGSFVFPTVGKVVPVPGGGKAATVAETDPIGTSGSPGSSGAVGPPPDADAPVAPAEHETRIDPQRLAMAHELPQSLDASGAATQRPAETGAKPVADMPARPPVPRNRPTQPVVRPPSGAGELTVDPLAPQPDRVAAPSGDGDIGAGTARLQKTTPTVAQQEQRLSAPSEPGPEFRSDESNDPLAAPTIVIPADPSGADAHVPPADIPDVGSGGGSAAAEIPEPREEQPTADWDEAYQSALSRWVVLDVRNGRAVIDGRERGVFMVVEGSEIPGVGIVENIRRRDGRWRVLTTGGAIYGAEQTDRRRFWLSRLLQ
jgi:hypothetical protein